MQLKMQLDITNLVEAVTRVARHTPAGLDDPAAAAKLVAELVEFDRAGTTIEELGELADVLHYSVKLLLMNQLTPGAVERIVEPLIGDIAINIRWSDLGGLYQAKYDSRIQYGKCADRERVALAEWVITSVRNLCASGMTISDAASFIADPDLRACVVRALEIEALAEELECDTRRAAEMYDLLLVEGQWTLS